MNTMSIAELPTEILQNCVFKYLADIDIYNLGKAGNSRLRKISEDVSELGKSAKKLQYVQYDVKLQQDYIHDYISPSISLSCKGSGYWRIQGMLQNVRDI